MSIIHVIYTDTTQITLFHFPWMKHLHHVHWICGFVSLVNFVNCWGFHLALPFTWSQDSGAKTTDIPCKLELNDARQSERVFRPEPSRRTSVERSCEPAQWHQEVPRTLERLTNFDSYDCSIIRNTAPSDGSVLVFSCSRKSSRIWRIWQQVVQSKQILGRPFLWSQQCEMHSELPCLKRFTLCVEQFQMFPHSLA